MPSAAAAEFEIVSEYLESADGPLVQGDHCRRQGGGRQDLGIASDLDVAGTNSILTHHRQWHMDIEAKRIEPGFKDDENTYGDDFRDYHQYMLDDYDAWRLAHGFAPTPTWDPATPVPPEDRYPSPIPPGPWADQLGVLFVPAAVCLPHKSEDPKIPLPSWATVPGGTDPAPLFNYTSLCEFPSINRLGKSIDPPEGKNFHGNVHNAIQGDMGPVYSAPRDPLFWPWHNFLEVNVFKAWETDCQPAPEVARATEAQPSVPGLEGVGSLLVLVGCMFFMRRHGAP